MTRIQPNYGNGIEYIRLSDLPFTQKQKFSDWISVNSTFKMKVDNGFVEDCVFYSEYEYWLETQNNVLTEENLFF